MVCVSQMHCGTEQHPCQVTCERDSDIAVVTASGASDGATSRYAAETPRYHDVEFCPGRI
jgi:hypothetical protein